ncbi:transcription antitermination factor NusB [Acidobacteriota bacterium]
MFRVKYSRETILKLLYLIDVLELSGEYPAEILKNNENFLKALTSEEEDFIIRIIKKIEADKETIDDLIRKNLIGWKLGRLMSIDRCLLRMGIAESHFNDQKAVIIDDIIRIAKKYGGEESYKIINAILDKVI